MSSKVNKILLCRFTLSFFALCHSTNNETWKENKRFKLTVPTAGTSLHALLEVSSGGGGGGASPSGIGFMVTEVPVEGDLQFSSIVTESEIVGGDYVEKKLELEAGHYYIMPVTFNPGEHANYEITVYSNKNILLKGMD